MAGSLLVKEMLRALPALISTLERGHGGDHSKDKKGGCCYPYIMLEKKIQRAVTNSPWCILASSPGPKILGGERNILQTSHISECKELLNFQRKLLVFASKCVPYKLRVSKNPYQGKTHFFGENEGWISELGVKKVRAAH